jgi:hypothetical protein
MNKKLNIIIIIVGIVAVVHWYFGTKALTYYSYPIFNTSYWYTEILKTWIDHEDTTRLKIWNDTIPIFVRETNIKIPNIDGKTIITLNPKSSEWENNRGSLKCCMIIQEEGYYYPIAREYKLMIRDYFEVDSTNAPIILDNKKAMYFKKMREWHFVLFGKNYHWYIGEFSKPGIK